MAVTPVNALQAREKARGFIRSSGVFYLLKTFFLQHVTVNQNVDLLYVTIDGQIHASDSGNTVSQILADAPCKVYAFYLKKAGSTATFFKVTNHASTASTDGTQDIGYKMTTSGEENFLVFPAGHAFSTGVTITEDTTATGSTLTLNANRIDGFAIIGAA